MNKLLSFILLVCIAGVLGAPRPQEKEPVPIISSVNQASVDGTYHYSYEGGDGTKAQEDGQPKQVQDEEGKPAIAESVVGAYSYVGDDGQTYSVQYVADETGFHPEGAHLPVAPPIPEAIQRALDYIATAPPPKERK